MTDTTTTHPELGFYTLAGQPETARDLLDEVRLEVVRELARRLVAYSLADPSRGSLPLDQGAIHRLTEFSVVRLSNYLQRPPGSHV